MKILYLGTFVLILLIRYRNLRDAINDFQKLVFTAIFLLISLLFVLYIFQDSMIYRNNPFPEYKAPQNNPAGLRSPAESGMDFEDIYFTSHDGLLMHSWLIFAKNYKNNKNKKFATIIFFHGNSANMGFRLPFIKSLWKNTGCNVYVVSYRGYGNSQGTPSEENLKIDAIYAWEHIKKHNNIDRSQVFFYGRSIGGAVAIHLTSTAPTEFSGLVLENTFTSMGELVNSIYPFLRIFKSLVLRNEWNSIEKIAKLDIPLLFISGQSDTLVPKELMERLYNAAVMSKNKQMLRIENGEHNDTFQVGKKLIIDTLQAFLAYRFQN